MNKNLMPPPILIYLYGTSPQKKSCIEIRSPKRCRNVRSYSKNVITDVNLLFHLPGGYYILYIIQIYIYIYIYVYYVYSSWGSLFLYNAFFTGTTTGDPLKNQPWRKKSSAAGDAVEDAGLRNLRFAHASVAWSPNNALAVSMGKKIRSV